MRCEIRYVCLRLQHSCSQHNMCTPFWLQAPWEIVCIDPFLPQDRRRRYDMIHGGKQIGLPFHSLRMYHHFGGQMPDVHFVCKLPDSVVLSENGASTSVAMINGLPEVIQLYEQIKKLSRPKAHTQMARALERRWNMITKLSPAVARGILRDVAGYELIGFDTCTTEPRVCN